jgi:hypothetical protein
MRRKRRFWRSMRRCNGRHWDCRKYLSIHYRRKSLGWKSMWRSQPKKNEKKRDRLS